MAKLLNDMTTIAPRIIHHLESRDSRHTFIIGAALSNPDGAFYIELYILACAQYGFGNDDHEFLPAIYL